MSFLMIPSSLLVVAAVFGTMASATAQPPPGPTPLIVASNLDLSADTTQPLIIAADDLTLDCKGFSITIPPGAPFGFGILMDNRKGIKILNCKIDGAVPGRGQFIAGISMIASSAEFSDVETNGNLVNGLRAVDSSRVLISGPFEANDNGVFGIETLNDVAVTVDETSIVTEGNGVGGIQIALRSTLLLQSETDETKPATVTSTNSGQFGVTIVSNSHLFLFGFTTVESSDNAGDGLTIFSQSGAEFDRAANLITNDNGRNGVRMEDSTINMFSVDPSTTPTLTSIGNTQAGLAMGKKAVFDTNLVGTVTIQQNQEFGVLADERSAVTFRNADITNNSPHNVLLKFGSSGDFENNSMGGRIRCTEKSSILLRGDELPCLPL